MLKANGFYNCGRASFIAGNVFFMRWPTQIRSALTYLCIQCTHTYCRSLHIYFNLASLIIYFFKNRNKNVDIEQFNFSHTFSCFFSSYNAPHIFPSETVNTHKCNFPPVLNTDSTWHKRIFSPLWYFFLLTSLNNHFSFIHFSCVCVIWFCASIERLLFTHDASFRTRLK